MQFFDGINHPSSQQVKAAGCAGCLMYGGTPGDSLGKDFTAAQYADYKAAGLLTVFVFENTANDMAGGFNAGAANAHSLMADLRTKGVNPYEPIGSTVDEHVAASNIPLAVQYQNGFWSAVKASGWAGPVGGYGFAEFLVAIHDARLAEWFWGAGTRSLLPPYTNLWQDNTGTIQVGGSADDRDWVLIPLPGEDLTPDEHAWLEDLTRRVQSIHLYGFGPLPADLTTVPRWSQGGDLSWLDKRETTELTAEQTTDADVKAKTFTLAPEALAALQSTVTSAVTAAVTGLSLAVSPADVAAVAKASADATVSAFAKKLAA